MKGRLVFAIFILGLAVYAMFFLQEYQIDKIVIKDVNLADVEDGIYKGEYKTMFVSATVQVKVFGQRITDITIINHENSQGKRAEKVINDVKDKQSLDVDIITGATASSKVILKAIENALK